MVRARLIAAICVLLLAAAPGVAGAESKDKPQQSVPSANQPLIDRGYGQGDACFGDKHETDDDLKTGNEAAVLDALRLLLGPGT